MASGNGHRDEAPEPGLEPQTRRAKTGGMRVSNSSAMRVVALLVVTWLAVGCGSGNGGAATGAALPETTATGASPGQGVASEFVAEVWADNWFVLYVNGELAGEDSTPITTERSFNSETIVFTAPYPLTIGIEARDFKETNSGIEYIGKRNQQMGDDGVIAQITDVGTGKVVAVTNRSWRLKVIHRAPLNPECEKALDPDAACLFESTKAPPGWASVEFDAGIWGAATEWTVTDVRPKDGYDTIQWDDSAQLIWGSDLEVDNTILLRLTVPSPSGS